MQTVTLYTRAGCGLCNEVKQVLDALADQHPHHLIEVDISQDAALLERYRFAIPVVVVGETELRAPITRQMLVEGLTTAV